MSDYRRQVLADVFDAFLERVAASLQGRLQQVSCALEWWHTEGNNALVLYHRQRHRWG
jgi:hypothetical protein